ncbi:hypothetical protein [Flavobacterium lacisediminis]|uniref:Uncharacterized protein n=1 Tax=Flavobacterium lacisediminis TaxID=2989705 RepID=A0ABT3EI61_9FLAO|nr:hypothetical protein [Flavobacterium lacisediminis]MCW1148262.1 hypothetical protein [Flavobacterium lacisediminis]
MKADLNGTWLFVKTGGDYGKTDLIEFDNDDILHFTLERSDDLFLHKVRNQLWNEKLNEEDFKFLNPNRIRLFRKGIKRAVSNFNEASTSTECIFELDYERLFPTQTDLSEEEIQLLKFDFSWNNNKKIIVFNDILDSRVIQELNKSMNRIGSRILLERFNETLFLSFYDDIYVDFQIPIKYVDSEIMVLYGFPNEPYEVTCTVKK